MADKKSKKAKRYEDVAKATTLANADEPFTELTQALPQEPIILSPIHVWQLGYEQRRLKRERERGHKVERVIDPENDPRWKKRGEE